MNIGKYTILQQDLLLKCFNIEVLIVGFSCFEKFYLCTKAYFHITLNNDLIFNSLHSEKVEKDKPRQHHSVFVQRQIYCENEESEELGSSFSANNQLGNIDFV